MTPPAATAVAPSLRRSRRVGAVEFRDLSMEASSSARAVLSEVSSGSGSDCGHSGMEPRQSQGPGNLAQRKRSDVGQDALAEEPDRLHDPVMRRPARMGMAEPQQERARAGRLLPALELSDAGVGVSQDQAIRGEILQREFRAGGQIAELGQ